MNIENAMKGFFREGMKRRGIVLLFTLAVTAVVSLYSLLTPYTYKATAQIYIGEGAASSTIKRDGAAWREYIDRQYGSIKTRASLEKILSKIGPAASKEFAGGEALSILERSVQVHQKKGANIITIDVYMHDPEMASAIAKALADEYIAAIQRQTFDLSEEARAWLIETSEISAKVRASREALADFMTKNSIEDPRAGSKMLKDTLALVTSERARRLVALEALGNEKERFGRYLESKDVNGMVSMLKDDMVVKNLLEDKEQQKAKLKTLMEKGIYQEAHPEILALKNSLDSIDDTLMARFEQQSSRYDAEVRSSKENLDVMDKEIEVSKKDIERTEHQTIEFDTLSQEAERYHKLYETALGALNTGKFAIIENKETVLADQGSTTVPVAPNKERDILLAIMGGFIGGNWLSILLARREKRGQKA